MTGATKPPLPEGWYWLDAERASKIEQELAREVSPGHQLTDQRLRALATSDRRPEVLFERADDPGEYALVHLTWKVGDRPPWPTTILLPSFDDFVREARLRD